MKLRFLILGFILFFGFNGYSQITSLADFSEKTEFADSIEIFVFCTDDINGGSLVAVDSSNNGGYNFTWYEFDETDTTLTKLFAGSINDDVDGKTSTITGLANGGYRVVLTKADTTQEYFAWVYNNVGRSVEIQFDQYNNCDYLGLQTEPYYQRNQKFDTDLIYFDLETKDSYILRNEISLYEWNSTPDEDDFRKFNGPFASIIEEPEDNESELPTENTIFSVTVTDRFGCVVEDDIDYTAIETDADFTWSTIDYKTGDILQGDKSSSEEISEGAPVYAQFNNESKNGFYYKWYFGDETRNDDIDSLITTDISEIAEHVYYYTNTADTGKTYKLGLYSESEYGCLDSILFDIAVEPVKLEFPNVFSPNDDGVNDVYIIENKDDKGESVEEYQSIRNFKITIFNRAGQVVHEFDGDICDWDGWDGTVKNSNRKAPQGNYFFVVEVKGWDRKKYDNKNVFKLSPEGDKKPEDINFGIIRLYR